MRKSSLFNYLVLSGMTLLVLCHFHSRHRQVVDRPDILLQQRMVAELSLTDLVLATDARYARHPSQADTHAPFQDAPLSLEHFPSGALVGPPPHLRTP